MQYEQELDSVTGSPGSVMAFLEAVADAASTMLCSLKISAEKLQAYMAEGERKFSCQVRNDPERLQSCAMMAYRLA